MSDLRAIVALVTNILERSGKPVQIEAAEELKRIAGEVMLALEEKDKRILDLSGLHDLAKHHHHGLVVINGQDDMATLAEIMKDKMSEMPELPATEYLLAPPLEMPAAPKERKHWSKHHKGGDRHY